MRKKLVRVTAMGLMFATGSGVIPVGARAASWTSFETNCSERRSGVNHWIGRRCYEVKRLSKDSNGSKDYFQIKVTVTGNTVDGYKMAKLMAVVKPLAGSVVQEFDGVDPVEPSASVSTVKGCADTNYSISGGEPVTFGFSQSIHTCDSEEMNPLLKSVPGSHGAEWFANQPTVRAGVVRRVAVMVSVRVPQGKLARWNFENWNITKYG